MDRQEEAGPYSHWTKLDEALAEEVMGWSLVSLSDPNWNSHWPAWSRSTRMRLAWMAEDPEDGCALREEEPGNGKNGRWKPAWIPKFSSDLRWAGRLVRGIRAHGGASLSLTWTDEGGWTAVVQTTSGPSVKATDPEAAMAISKAALEFCARQASAKKPV